MCDLSIPNSVSSTGEGLEGGGGEGREGVSGNDYFFLCCYFCGFVKYQLKSLSCIGDQLNLKD